MLDRQGVGRTRGRLSRRPSLAEAGQVGAVEAADVAGADDDDVCAHAAISPMAVTYDMRPVPVKLGSETAVASLPVPGRAVSFAHHPSCPRPAFASADKERNVPA